MKFSTCIKYFNSTAQIISCTNTAKQKVQNILQLITNNLTTYNQNSHETPITELQRSPYGAHPTAL